MHPDPPTRDEGEEAGRLLAAALRTDTSSADQVRAIQAWLNEYAEDVQFAHELRVEREHAAWAWRFVFRHAKWVVPLMTSLGAAIAYLAGHNIKIDSK